MAAEEAAVAAFLEAHDPSLAEAFRRHLPAARRGIRDRFLQACLREDIAGLRGRIVSAPAADTLVVGLADGTTLTAPLARRLSLERLDFAGPITLRRGEMATPLERAIDLGDLLRATRPPGDGTEEAWWERFCFELDNSTANYALALAGSERRQQALRREAGGRSLLEWLADAAARDASFSPLVFFEQWVIDGHPLHPGAKLKAGFAPADVLASSPEWEARPAVRIVAVARSACRVTRFRAAGPAAELAKQYPALAPLVAEAVRQRGREPADYEWIPVHPWQFEHVLPELAAAAIAAGTIIPVPAAVIPTASLMAVRSVAPLGPGSRRRHHLKTALGVQMTGAVRTVSPQAAANGPLLAEVLADVQAREQGFAGRLAVLLERVGVSFEPRPEDGSAEHRQQLAKNLAAVLRDNPEAELEAGELPLPGSALLAADPLGDGPIAAALIGRRAAAAGRPPAAAVAEWLHDYAAVALPGMLTLMTRYGIGLEGHLQNCVLVFLEGRPVRVLVRDMGGVRILPERLARHGLDIRLESGSATLAADAEDLRRKVSYALLQNHFGELIACLVRHFAVAEEDCWRPVAEVCQTTFDRLAADSGTAAAAATDRAHFFAPRLPLKALVRMRLCGVVTTYHFSEVGNPLAEYATGGSGPNRR